ncbi:MAG: Zn-dependent oligopeptidase [Candidatus Eisenbacteria bacterium]|nr:Zn-dependent oligopeptidase [Candidatus Eisenbacteria bacterium]
MQKDRLAKAKVLIDQLVAVKGRRTIENTLQPYDDAVLQLDATSSQSSLISEVHPDSALRAAAEKATQEASAFTTELSLNRRVYDALAAVDTSKADAETRFYLWRTLRDFRLAGVDKDDATRQRIKELSEKIVETGQAFSRNIREDKRQVPVKDASELAGLPEDYIARHKPGAGGHIVLTIDYPDALPVFSYAKSESLRYRMYMAYNDRAYPKNMATLDSLISQRSQLANLLGFTNWADCVTADKMVGSAKNASDFIDQIVAASGARAEREYRVLLERKQQDVPGATVVNGWEGSYWSEQVRKSNYNFDSQSVRPYFPYDRVKEGVLGVTSRMFGVEFHRVANAPVWDPSVECYEATENGKLVGRFYLDMHPRKDKYNHAAQFDVRTGVEGKQIPEAALICNFPGGEAGDPGLMEYGDVRTFFHEFGHLLHTLFAGHHPWCGIGGIRTEQDFVEAPSQMLEEWTENPEVLATFAKHYQSGQPIPAELVNQMNRAKDYGQGLGVRRQMVYAKLSLSIYDRDPRQVDTDAIVQDLVKKYQPFPYVPGTHFQCAFGHLEGYSAVYYTYMWSLVIAKDMFAQFDKTHLLAPGVATRYRQMVLAPGGTKPAAKLVANFLGRPFNNAAWTEWLNNDQKK